MPPDSVLENRKFPEWGGGTLWASLQFEKSFLDKSLKIIDILLVFFELKWSLTYTQYQEITPLMATSYETGKQ